MIVLSRPGDGQKKVVAEGAVGAVDGAAGRTVDGVSADIIFTAQGQNYHAVFAHQVIPLTAPVYARQGAVVARRRNIAPGAGLGSEPAGATLNMSNQLLLGDAQVSFSILERFVGLGHVAGHALLHHGGVAGAETNNGEQPQEDQPDDKGP